MSAATFAAASSCIAGNTWEYVSRVMAMLAWPKRSLTTFAGTLAASAADAELWRTSCNRICGSPARSAERTNSRLIR